MPPARFIQPSKNIPPIEYWTAYGPAAIYWLYAVQYSMGGMFCSQRKIQPETAQLPDLSTFRKVCANFHGR